MSFIEEEGPLRVGGKLVIVIKMITTIPILLLNKNKLTHLLEEYFQQ